MRKFKHKTAGYIAEKLTTCEKYKLKISTSDIIPAWVIENSNDWEEIIENNSKRLLYKENILYNVKRLSDNQEFTIGDKVLNSRNELKTILGFVGTCNIQVELGTGNFVDYIDNLCNIQHYKEPILITEDGVELFSGDTFHGVSEYYYIISGKVVSNYVSKTFKYFSTKELAEKYIEENKPMYSKKDMLSFGASMSSKLYPYQCEGCLEHWKRFKKEKGE